MIEVRLTLRPRAGKAKEVQQTLESVTAAILTQWGCTGCDFQAAGDGRSFSVVQSWSDHAAADAYLRSREHRALIGAIGTLCDEHTLSITNR